MTDKKPTARESNVSMVCTAILKLVELITHQYTTPQGTSVSTEATKPKPSKSASA